MLLCMGRAIELDLTSGKTIRPPRDHGMLYDDSGEWWPRCSLLITDFKRGSEFSEDSLGKNYFGDADFFEGSVELPSSDLAKWEKRGTLDTIYYDRAGQKAPGFFRHQFHAPRGLWKIVFLFKKAAKEPAIVWKLERRTPAYRIELPEGCIVSDLGIVLP